MADIKIKDDGTYPDSGLEWQEVGSEARPSDSWYKDDPGFQSYGGGGRPPKRKSSGWFVWLLVALAALCGVLYFGFDIGKHASYLYLSDSTLTINDYTGDYEWVSVDCDARWDVFSLDDWITVTKDGRDSFKISVGWADVARTGTVYVYADEYSCELEVFQKGEVGTYITPDVTKVSFGYEGGERTINIDCDGQWEIGVDTYSWGHIEKHDDYLILTIDRNDSDDRTDFFTVKTGEISQKIRISQKGDTNPRASIEKVWTDHNEYQNGVKGMKIHVKFDVRNMRGRRGNVAVYFHKDDSDGTELDDTNGRYKTTDGHVATHEYYTPSYDSSTYSDFTIFMPYDELHVTASGKHELKYDVLVWDDSSNELIRSNWVRFTLTNN